jgi:2-phospho-L-lactate guanylyltransferase
MSIDAAVSAVLLVKDTRQAKTRLGLAPDRAREVALALADQTLHALLDATLVANVSVVTSDDTVAGRTLALGATVVAEHEPIGMNRAAALGRSQALARAPGRSILVLVADLPQLESAEVDVLVHEHHASGSSLFVPDQSAEGTTALVHAAHRPLGFAFGRRSADLHRRLGYAPARSPIPGLRVDLDTPHDLDRHLVPLRRHA